MTNPILSGNNSRFGSYRWSILLPLIVILGIAFVLRLYHLGMPGLWLDEIGQARSAQKSVLQTLKIVQKHHGATPLDYMVTMVTVRMSHAHAILRFPAALWGTLSVYWIYRIGCMARSHRVGLIAAALLAVNVFHLRYSQELRFYSLFILLTLVTTDLLWQAWARDYKRSWILYGLFSLLMLYTHYFGVLVLGFHAIWVGLSWLFDTRNMARKDVDSSKLVRFALTAGSAMLLFLPWVIYDVPRETGLPTSPTPNLDWDLIRNVIVTFSGKTAIGWPLWVGLVLIGLVVLLVRNMPTGVLFGFWVFVPLPFIVIIDQQSDYFFHPRQVIFSLPIFLLLVALGVDAWGSISQHTVAKYAENLPSKVVYHFSAMALLLALFWISIPQIERYYTVEQLRREDIAFQPLGDVMEFHGAGQIVAANLHDDDRVALLTSNDHVSFEFYFSPAVQEQVRMAENLEDLQSLFASGQPMWVLTSPKLKEHPESDIISMWLTEKPAIEFTLQGGIHVHFFQEGRSRQDLWEARASHFHVPDRANLWASLGNALRPVSMQDALYAHEKAIELAIYDKPRDTYFVESGYDIPATDLPTYVIVETKAMYLADAGYDASFTNQFPLALNYLNQAIALEPHDSEAYVRKAMVLLKTGEPAEALDILTFVRHELGTENYWVRLFTANALRDLNHQIDAIEQYQQALVMNPEAHHVRFLIAQQYLKLGELEEARIWWRDYLDADPDGPFSKQVRDNLANQ